MINYNELRDGQEFYANGYKKGYENAKKEFERPIGEWVVVSNGTTNHYACSKCGHAGDFQDKFCRGCGVKMRKEVRNDLSI